MVQLRSREQSVIYLKDHMGSMYIHMVISAMAALVQLDTIIHWKGLTVHLLMRKGITLLLKLIK